MKAVLIANPKGGSGKTTLSTNIAGYLTTRGYRVTMLDLDRQKSTTQWLAARPAHLPAIALLQGDKNKAAAEWLIIDSPADLHD